MSEPEPPSDDPAVSKNRSNFLGTRGGRNVEVLWFEADPQVPDAAADQIGLVLEAFQTPDHFERIPIDQVRWDVGVALVFRRFCFRSVPLRTSVSPFFRFCARFAASFSSSLARLRCWSNRLNDQFLVAIWLWRFGPAGLVRGVAGIKAEIADAAKNAEGIYEPIH